MSFVAKVSELDTYLQRRLEAAAAGTIRVARTAAAAREAAEAAAAAKAAKAAEAGKAARMAAACAHERRLQDAEARRVQEVEWQLDLQRCGRAVGQGWGGQAGRGVPLGPSSPRSSRPTPEVGGGELLRAIQAVETTGGVTGFGLFRLLVHDEIESAGGLDAVGFTSTQLKAEVHREWRALGESERRRYHTWAAEATSSSQPRLRHRGARRGFTQGGATARPTPPLGEG